MSDEAAKDEPAQDDAGETQAAAAPDAEATDASVATEAASATGDSPAEENASAGSDEAKLGTEDIERLLDQASSGLDQAAGSPVTPGQEPQPYQLGDLTAAPDSQHRHPVDLLGDVELDLRIELGRTEMRLEEVLQLRGGSVVALDKLAGDPVDIYVNGRLIAHGEVLVMNDNFCVRVTELVTA